MYLVSCIIFKKAFSHSLHHPPSPQGKSAFHLYDSQCPHLYGKEDLSVFDKYAYLLLTVLIKKISITIFIYNSSRGTIWYQGAGFHGLWNIFPISFLASLLSVDYKKNWHVGDEFADSKLSNDYLSWFKLCSGIETLHYTVKSLKLMARLFHNSVSFPRDGYSINRQAVQISLHHLWFGVTVAPVLVTSKLDQSRQAVFKQRTLGTVLSIHKFLLYVESYSILSILGGKLFLSHTFSWGTWGSSVRRQ